MASSNVQRLKTLIESHRAYYEKTEKPSFEKARRYYRGIFVPPDKQEAALYTSTKNLIFAIADTALSAMLGNNPSISASPKNANSEMGAPVASALLDYVWDANKMRTQNRLALLDGVLCGRAVYKTAWSAKLDRPVIKARPPENVFFDLTTRDVDELGYWLDCCPIPLERFNAKLEPGGAYHALGRTVEPTRAQYPSWLLDTKAQAGQAQIREATQWVVVWEYYDRDANQVIHYLEDGDVELLNDKLTYVPFDLWQTNLTGVDCRGMSEVQLVMSQQETLNDLLTHMKQIVYMMIPRIFFDAGIINADELTKAMESVTGSFVPLSRANDTLATRNLVDAFWNQPLPELPKEVPGLAERQEGDAAYISALADLSRGQLAGAKTATEVAVLDAQMRNRLSTRQGTFDETQESIAAKAFGLCQRKMSKPKFVKIAGGKDWKEVGLADIQDLDVAFELVSDNPIRKNPMVALETARNLYGLMSQSGHFDMYEVSEYISDLAGIPSNLLRPEEEVKREQEAALAAAQAQQSGGAPAPTDPGAAPAPDAHAEEMLEAAEDLTTAAAAGLEVLSDDAVDPDALRDALAMLLRSIEAALPALGVPTQPPGAAPAPPAQAAPAPVL